MTCGDDEIEISEEDGREIYVCSENHTNQRLIQNKGLEYYEEDGEVIHCSVGAIIVYDGKILLLKRRKYPYKYSVPAGHLEEAENPDKAVLREVQEETGIEETSENFELVESKVIEDKCRRGADRHDWNLYRLELRSNPDISSNDEAEKLEWMAPEKVEEKELTAPTQKFLVEEDIL
jgi:ADP-ribose pyrophosphatase YjhB (NUDIX family)